MCWWCVRNVKVKISTVLSTTFNKIWAQATKVERTCLVLGWRASARLVLHQVQKLNLSSSMRHWALGHWGSMRNTNQMRLKISPHSSEKIEKRNRSQKIRVQSMVTNLNLSWCEEVATMSSTVQVIKNFKTLAPSQNPGATTSLTAARALLWEARVQIPYFPSWILSQSLLPSQVVIG